MRITVIALFLLLAPAARAHEVVLDVQRGRAVAVRVVESDGEPLAGAEYQLWGPADPQVPWQQGRTDRGGWLAFVPGPPGQWRLKVVEAGGHGIDTTLEVAAPDDEAAGAGAATGAGRVARPVARRSPPGSAGFVLRPLAAVAVIALVFAMLLALYRKKGRAP
jgi:nickel transport protein